MKPDGGSQPRAVSSKSESHSVVFDSLRPHGLCSPWNSPDQNIGVGSVSLLQGIFPIQESNHGLLHCRQILYQLGYQGSPQELINKSQVGKLAGPGRCRQRQNELAWSWGSLLFSIQDVKPLTGYSFPTCNVGSALLLSRCVKSGMLAIWSLCSAVSAVYLSRHLDLSTHFSRQPSLCFTGQPLDPSMSHLLGWLTVMCVLFWLECMFNLLMVFESWVSTLLTVPRLHPPILLDPYLSFSPRFNPFLLTRSSSSFMSSLRTISLSLEHSPRQLILLWFII